MRRLLVVANPFPPMAGAGTYRVLRFLRHLPTYGWEPTVLTTASQEPGALPEFVRIVRTPVPVPSRLLGRGRRVSRLNRWLFVPDQYAPWVPTAIAAGRRLLGDEHFDALLSSHPRASGHLVAAGLSRLTGTPWVADYRDRRFANTVVPFASPVHEAAQRRLETWALRQAAAVTAINGSIRDDLVAHHPQLAGRTSVLPNGFDDDDEVEPVDLGPGVWLVHTGKLYKRERTLEAFLTALAALPDDVKALFVGDEPRVAPIVARMGLGHRVRVEPFVPHAKALGYQRAADVLVLFTHGRPESMSSKVFEYLRSGRPVFAVTAPVTSASALLAEVGGGVTAGHDDDLRPPLAALVEAVRTGAAPCADQRALARYDMATVTAELAVVLGRLAGGDD